MLAPYTRPRFDCWSEVSALVVMLLTLNLCKTWHLMVLEDSRQLQREFTLCAPCCTKRSAAQRLSSSVHIELLSCVSNGSCTHWEQPAETQK